MRIAVISGRYPSTEFESPVNHRIYCDKNGYTYIHCNWPTKAKNPYLNKLHYIQEYMNHFDYLFWIDDDAFFLDLDFDIQAYLPTEKHFLSICKSPSFKALKTVFSAGQFLLRCDERGKQFIQDAMVADLSQIKKDWPESNGYFSNGDQDIFVYLSQRSEYSDGILMWDYQAFNSRFENLLDEDPHPIAILHLTGPKKRKRVHYRAAQKLTNSGIGLLSKQVSKEYSISKGSAFSRALNWLKKRLP
jgi:hypothetical protein